MPATIDEVPATPPDAAPVDGAAFADLANGPDVVEALRRFYRYGTGVFPDRAPPRVATWGSAQCRMASALAPLLDENARLRAALAERDGAPSA